MSALLSVSWLDSFDTGVGESRLSGGSWYSPGIGSGASAWYPVSGGVSGSFFSRASRRAGGVGSGSGAGSWGVRSGMGGSTGRLPRLRKRDRLGLGATRAQGGEPAAHRATALHQAHAGPAEHGHERGIGEVSEATQRGQ